MKLEIFRGTQGVLVNAINPLHFEWHGVFGPGAYFSPNFNPQYAWSHNAHEDRGVETNFGVSSKYEVEFKNILVLTTSMVDGLENADTVIPKEDSNEQIKALFKYRPHGIDSPELGAVALSKGFDAIWFKDPSVEGGDQVFIPHGSDVTIRLMEFFIITRSKNLVKKLSEEITVAKTSRSDNKYLVVGPFSSSQSTNVDEVLSNQE